MRKEKAKTYSDNSFFIFYHHKEQSGLCYANTKYTHGDKIFYLKINDKSYLLKTNIK